MSKYTHTHKRTSVSSVNLNVPQRLRMYMECVHTIFYGKGLIKERAMRGLLSQMCSGHQENSLVMLEVRSYEIWQIPALDL